jgi:hypothetical protein
MFPITLSLIGSIIELITACRNLSNTVFTGLSTGSRSLSKSMMGSWIAGWTSSEAIGIAVFAGIVILAGEVPGAPTGLMIGAMMPMILGSNCTPPCHA